MKHLTINLPAITISLPAALKWILAAFVMKYSAASIPMQSLFWLMVIDFATGFLKAWKRGEVSSNVGKWGAIKKLGIILLIESTSIASKGIGQEFHAENFGATVFIVTEFASIIENLAGLGVPVPSGVVSGLVAVKRLYRTATPDQIEELEQPKSSGAANGQK